MVKRLAGLFLISALWGAAVAQQVSPSTPLIPVPDISVDVPNVLAGDIPDLATAPPVTIAAILRLANLGAYPFAEGFLAQPNEPASQADLAFVLVNLFAPTVNGEFPVPAETALAYLQEQLAVTAETGAEQTLQDTPEEDVVTGEEALQALSAVLQLSPEAEATVRSALVEGFPAFGAGNFDIILTRAALALFGSLALDGVNAQSAEPL